MEDWADSLRDKAVLVTGGAAGIGWAVAQAFRARGAHVALLDRSFPGGTCEPGMVCVEGRAEEPSDNERAVAATVDAFGSLDVLVANAGVHDGGVRLADVDIHALDALLTRVLDVNVRGYVMAAKAAMDPLLEREGRIVLTLSDAAFVVRGNGTGVAYATSKHAGLGILRSLASELAPRVQVNAVAPGGVITTLRTADLPDGSGGAPVFAEPDTVQAAVEGFAPLGTMLSAEELARYYLFLASSAAKGMTGEVLRPDGGLVVR